MTNLTRLRLSLVDLSGLMKKKTHLKQNILFFKRDLSKEDDFVDQFGCLN